MSHSQLVEALNKEPGTMGPGLCGVGARGHMRCIECILAKNLKARIYRRENKSMGVRASGSLQTVVFQLLFLAVSKEDWAVLACTYKQQRGS